MTTLSDKPDREEVLSFLCYAAAYGNLGGFIGAGFSKAVLGKGVALSWGELLEQCAGRLEVDYAAALKPGASYPDVASALCAQHSDESGVSYGESLSKLKRIIADLTCWYPDKKKREAFAKHLRALNPAWIITTNYDLVIESLLTGRAVPLGPNDSLIAPKDVVPVYHLHGLRTNPEELIIAQEDYVALFRPNEYRQIKLALTIKESTTLIIGYGLGDVNVLTALDWSRNVFKGEPTNYPNGLVQLVRGDKKKPYRDRNGIVIVEAESVGDFFEEFTKVQEKYLQQYDSELEALKKLAEELVNPDKSIIDYFIDDQEFRADVLQELGNSPIHLIAGFVSFLDKCIDETWRRSEPKGAFEGYNQNLIILLDILMAFPIAKMPPALLQTAAYALDRVAPLIGDTWGQSFSASTTWKTRKKNLDASMVAELRNLSQQHSYVMLELLIKDL